MSSEIEKEISIFFISKWGVPSNPKPFILRGPDNMQLEVLVDKTWDSQIRRCLSRRKKITYNGMSFRFSGIGYDENDILTCYFQILE